MLFLKKLNVLLSKVWFSEIIAVGQREICIESLKWVEHNQKRNLSWIMKGPLGLFNREQREGDPLDIPSLTRCPFVVSKFELGLDISQFARPCPRPEA